MSNNIDIQTSILGELRQKNIVYKSNFLIEQSYKLEASEQKLLLGLISLINSDPEVGDKHFNIYRIRIKDIYKLFGFKSKGSFDHIKKMSDGLTWKGFVYYEDQDNGTKKRVTVNWLSKSSYVYKDGEGYLEVKISEDIKPFLLELKGAFTKYVLGNVLKLKNPYSIRIYELSQQYANMGERIINLDVFKTILQIEKKYPMYGNLKAKILDIAKDEINNNTDLIVDFEPVKEGKKVVALKFIINRNKKTSTIENPLDGFGEGTILENKLLSIGIKSEVIDNLIMEYGKDFLEEKYLLLNTELKKKTVDDPAGWFISSVRKNYTSSKKIELPKKQGSIVDFYDESKTEFLENKKKNNEKNFTDYFSSLNDQEKNELINEFFEKEIKGKFIEKSWKGDINDKGFKVLFRVFILIKIGKYE